MFNKMRVGKELVSAIIINIVLFFLFINTNSIMSQIILCPFLVCGIASLGRVIFMILNKPKYVQMFGNVYIFSLLVYWFGFLILIDYICIRDHEYVGLLTSLLFWGIGIYVIYVRYLKEDMHIKPKRKLLSNDMFIKKKQIGIKLRKIFLKLLVIGCFIAGCFMLTFGIKDVYKINLKSKNYREIDGYLSNYQVYSDDDNNATYQLEYSYKVNHKEYKIFIDYGVGILPKKGSTRKILYNPNNPAESTIVGATTGHFLIFMGIIFTLIPLVMIIDYLTSRGYLNSKLNFLGSLIMGIFF